MEDSKFVAQDAREMSPMEEVHVPVPPLDLQELVDQRKGLVVVPGCLSSHSLARHVDPVRYAP
jgi:hypothetical protein